MNSIYFDHAATTPMHPAAIEAYVEAASAGPSNPSSLHASGRAARERISAARDAIAELLGCSPAEIVFTGSGTESDNSALFGAARAQRERGRTGIVTTAVEHHAVLNACRRLEAEGFVLTVLPVDEFGRVSLEDAEAAIGDDTAVVSVMAGNNETGALQPIAEIGELARRRKALMHVDAVQAFGYLPLNLRELPIDLLSVSAHKINGPQGVGLLYVRRGTPWLPLLHGGSQERSRRAGTENVAGIAAFAAAADVALKERASRWEHAESVRTEALKQLSAQLGSGRFVVNGHPDDRLPHVLNVSFPGISSESMLMNLDLAGIAASGGSACNSGSLKPSHVLEAMNLPSDRIGSAVRFSFGLGNTIDQAEKMAKIIATISARYA
ncbi:cysteine desulfurase NifS [Cohnella sp. CIP 111063]|uniref:cysteine desulfurase family protein n=1 Tax=unclassified Cohnella TaxID=2636738 RepID=UPI000B8C070B|nr:MULTISPECIES: cysteine desulfurase family protein [unclassified Cohnella]OXS62581.1 cysteine desulfurase NifS [Cohnella sp. CIP 111063]PRX74834.1 cysteine desulfurase [Cohnella sp. SGD-V74]